MLSLQVRHVEEVISGGATRNTGEELSHRMRGHDDAEADTMHSGMPLRPAQQDEDAM
jgi:hypothetical protein